MEYTVEIDEFDGVSRFVVYVTSSKRRDENYEDYVAHTLAEAYLWIAKHFHGLGMDELQNRINKLDDVETRPHHPDCPATDGFGCRCNGTEMVE